MPYRHAPAGPPPAAPRHRHRRSAALAAVLLLASLLTGTLLAGGEGRAAAVSATTFTNPLLENGADPWMEYYDGNYYLATTTWTSQLVMRKAPTVDALADAEPVTVWSSTDAADCCNFWAFEFHRLPGTDGAYHWYMMFTSGQADTLDHQHLGVLESVGDDPLGPYSYKGAPLGTAWGIDGTYLELDDELYLLYSAWSGSYQNLYIKRMTDPWTTTGSAVRISTPTYSWETVGGNTNEGPEVLQHDGDTFVTFSASSCATPDYALGLLTLTGSDPMSASSWTKKPTAVFSRDDAAGVYGPGHNGFLTSPDGTENWLVYHANDSTSDGCGSTRSTRIQEFTWNSDGTPDFGTPLSTATSITVPSGETAPGTLDVQGTAYTIVGRSSSACLGIASGSTADGGNAQLVDCSAAGARWVLDPTSAGYYRLVDENSGRVLDTENCATADGTAVRQWQWLDNTCQEWSLESTSYGWYQVVNRNSGLVLDTADCATATGTDVRLWSDLSNTCQEWRLEPQDAVALVSSQSGRVADVANCATTAGTDVRQWQWLDNDCQRWTFLHVSNGYYQVKTAISDVSRCLLVSGASTADGGDVVLGTCSGTQAQWQLDPLADGSLRLVNRNSALVLDLADCGLGDGTDLQQWSWLDNTCQRFHLRST